MATPTLAQARSHYEQQRRITQIAVSAVRQLWRRTRRIDVVARSVGTYQYASAAASARTIAAWAGDTESITQPAAFVGFTGEGFRVEDALAPLLEQMLEQVEAEAAEEIFRLDRAVQSMVSDAGRSASQVEFVARPDWQNYVRMLTPPSCARCAILAGRVYRDLDAFARHPGCDCVMVPVQDWEEAHDNGLASSFKQLFEAGGVGSYRTDAAGNKVFHSGLSKADAQAIRDGANPAQVVNAYRHLSTPGTTAAIVVDGQKVTTTRAPRGSARLRPEAIYKLAGGDRAKAVTLLARAGYLKGDVDPSTLVKLEDKLDLKKPTDDPADLFARLAQGIKDAQRDRGTGRGDDDPPLDELGPSGPQRTPLGDLFTDTSKPGPAHEAFVEGTWRAEMDRAFGSVGLRAEYSFAAFFPDRFHVAGEILTPGGYSVGGFDRLYIREPDGTLVAHHEFLQITDKNLQGTGFAREFNEALYDWYRFSGVQRVELDANIDVGGYTWARDGYDFMFEQSAVSALTRLAAEPIRDNEDAAAVADVLDRATRFNFGDPEYPSAMEISQAGRMPHHRGRAASWPGKRAMIGLNKQWAGVLWL